MAIASPPFFLKNANMQMALPVNIRKQRRRVRGNICFDRNNERFTLPLTVAKKERPQEDYNLRFRDQDIVFADGAKDPAKDRISKFHRQSCNYFHVISSSADLPKLAIDGKLFLPASDNRKRNGKLPLVMVVPGSLGVAPSHLKHAETVVADGFAAFVLIVLVRAT